MRGGVILQGLVCYRDTGEKNGARMLCGVRFDAAYASRGEGMLAALSAKRAAKYLQKRRVSYAVFPKDYPYAEVFARCGVLPPPEKPLRMAKEARGFGDLSENSEYDEAKNEQGKLYSRIAEVEEILLHTVIVDENDAGTNGISIGCRVTVQDVKSGRELPEYKVVGSQEADPMHRAISEDSPFGKALMGAKEGDEVMVEAPVGTIVYRIVKIER